LFSFARKSIGKEALKVETKDNELEKKKDFEDSNLKTLLTFSQKAHLINEMDELSLTSTLRSKLNSLETNMVR
jgi:hypothetical protein